MIRPYFTLAAGSLFQIACMAQTFTTLASFNGANGQAPQSNGPALVQGTDGYFYGTTPNALSVSAGNVQAGNVFKMSPSGTLSNVYTFCSVPGCADGFTPSSGLIRGTDGYLYGTTQAGGPSELGANGAGGTVFKVSPSGVLTTIYGFCSVNTPQQCTDGVSPGALVAGTDGNFYGTSGGGTHLAGTVFKITSSGTLTTLYNFGSIIGPQSYALDGADPDSPLIQGADGNFYGTTRSGGANGLGIVFKITPAGALTTIYNFSYSDGAVHSGLTQATDGNFYGTTANGGVGAGTIFMITPAGASKTLWTFCQGSCSEGASPASGLIQAGDGNLYGTTSSTYHPNTIFKITLDGKLTTMYTFGTNPTDGSNPVGTLIQGADSNLYGTTVSGGVANIGTIFRLQLAGAASYTCTNITPPVISSIDSASAYGAYNYFASGSWLEIKGSNLADPNDPRLSAATNPGQWTTADFTGSNAPTSLDGISVSINGKPAYVWFLSPGQINVQAPEDTATGNVAITITNCKATSQVFTFTRRDLAPGLLAPTNYAANGTQYMVATFQSDGAYVLNTATGATLGLNSRPAKPGDVIVAYGIGFGDVTPSTLPGVITTQSNALVNPVTISFGTTQASVAYAGLAGSFVGLYEFYFTVPTLPSGDYQIVVTQNGVTVPQKMYLTVLNGSAPPTTQVKSLTLSVTAVNGGDTAQGTVTLSAAAPAGGAVVALSSNSAVATVPATVTVPAGLTSATFTISTIAVSSNQPAVITASYGGGSAQASLTINGASGPNLPPFTQITFNATFSTAGGETSNNDSSDIVIVNGGPPASVGVTFNGPLVYNISGQFAIAINSRTITLTPSPATTIQFGPSFTNYNVTGGSIVLNLTPQGAQILGSMTGTFSLTTSFATVTGTISGTYSGS